MKYFTFVLAKVCIWQLRYPKLKLLLDVIWYVHLACLMAREQLLSCLAYLLPRDLVYWCAIRVAAEATVRYSKRTPSEISVEEALRAWL